jgi:hypothetical protein
MSQKEMTDTLGHQEVSESSIGNLSRLAGLARQAYEQKRAKDCLDLTRAILLIDPDDADALWMRSSVQSQIRQDLENARAFLVQAESKDSAEEEAVTAPVHAAVPRDPEHEDTVPQAGQEPSRLVPASSEIQDTKPKWWGIACGIVGLGLVLGGFVWVLVKPRPAQSLQNVSAFDGTKPIANAEKPGPFMLAPSTEPGPAPVADPEPPPTAAAIPHTVEPRLTADKSSALPLSSPRPIEKQELPLVAAALGTLAVSSPTSVDIYEGDQYLGSAPVSLELPAGMHTLEYRHGNLRKTVTRDIHAIETARETVTFDITVQINSRPWAEVFLDGVDRKGLGQTPLSGVRVPIGSVLIFQNPQFQPKKYRVTGNETGIQIVFP